MFSPPVVSIPYVMSPLQAQKMTAVTDAVVILRYCSAVTSGKEKLYRKSRFFRLRRAQEKEVVL